MKSVATERSRAGILGVKKDKNCSIMKPNSGIDFSGEKFNLSEEMKECFLQLSSMVPEVPRNAAGNIDGTVLMQYVIDYILDLELQLGGTGDIATAMGFSQAFSLRPADSRAPLSEKSIENIVHSSQSSLTSQLSASLLVRSPMSECDFRPPSK